MLEKEVGSLQIKLAEAGEGRARDQEATSPLQVVLLPLILQGCCHYETGVAVHDCHSYMSRLHTLSQKKEVCCLDHVLPAQCPLASS